MGQQIEFTIADVRFQGRFLDPEVSFSVLTKLGPVFEQVLSQVGVDRAVEAARNVSDPDPVGEVSNEGDEVPETALSVIENLLFGALRALPNLPQFAPPFLDVYGAYLGQASKPMPLNQVKKEIFAGKSHLLMAWLITAITKEYAGFLGSEARSCFQAMASQLSYLVESAGQSGASPPTPESKTD